MFASFLQQLIDDDSGQDLIEYALIATLVGISAATAMRGLSSKFSTVFNTIGTGLTSAL